MHGKFAPQGHLIAGLGHHSLVLALGSGQRLWILPLHSVGMHTCNPSAEETEAGACLGSLDSQPNMFREFQDSVKPSMSQIKC